MRVLILGVNGFIGNALTAAHPHRPPTGRSSASTWAADKLEHFLDDKRFHFLEGDITINKEWIEYHVKKCDVVLPLVAIATPATYVKNPLAVFELDFEENLRIVKQCARYGKRVVFPSHLRGLRDVPRQGVRRGALAARATGRSTSSAGSTPRASSCSTASSTRYGQQQGLQFTLFRPFNWIGPQLDNVDSPRKGARRVVTQFLHNILYGEPIQLVDGGKQRRCFTYIEDGIDALMTILENEDGCADGGSSTSGTRRTTSRSGSWPSGS